MIVEVAVPSATTPLVGFAVAVVSAASIVVALPMNATVGCWATRTWPGPGFTVAVIVFVSAVVDAIVPVAIPKASVGAAGCVSVFEEPLEASCTVWPGTGFPFASRTVTVIVEVAVPSATTSIIGLAVADVSVASIVVALPMNATVGCCATTICPTPGFTVAVTVFVSAVVDAIVPVAVPFASVVPAGCVSVFEEPLEASCTVWPGTGFPFASRTVTVIVEVAVPSATTSVVGFAVAVVSVASIVVASPMNATVDCCATTTWVGPGFTVAVSVFVSAVVDAIVPVATPRASVVAAGCVSVFDAPVDASCTVWPATGFPFASRTVTVMVEVAVPSATTSLVGFAVAVVRVASIVVASPMNATVGCWATTTWLGPGFTVAVTVFDSAIVEASVPVATPKASVVAAGCVSVFEVPVEASWTVWPATGLPFASRTVTVIVEAAVPSATTSLVGFAVAVVSAASIVEASPMKPTVGCCVTTIEPGPGLIVAVIVFVSAIVEAIVPVATPRASVVAAGCVSVFEVPVEASWTVWPATGFPFASRTVTVIVEVDVPFATTPVVGFAVAVVSAASIVEASPMNPTVGCCATMTWLGPGLIVAVIVFDPEAVDAIVPVATPFASVVAAGWPRTLFAPVAPSMTVWPGTGLLFASRTVTVIVARSTPLATTFEFGTTETVESPPLIVPGFAENVTVACWRRTTWFGPGFTVAVIVFDSAVVDASAPKAKPSTSVTAGGCVSVLPEPVAASWTVCPGTGLPFASKTWTVMAVVVTPSAAMPVSGVAETVPSVALIVLASAMKPTVGCWVTTTCAGPGSIVAVIVFVSARVETIVPLVAPVASVVEAGCVSTSFVPVVARRIVRPETGFPFTSRTVTVIVEASAPSATTSIAGFAVAPERPGLIALASPTKPIVGCWTTTIWEGPGLIVAVMIFVSAVVEAIVPLAVPAASVVAAGCVSVLLAPVAARATVWPGTGLPNASATVTVIVERARSFATTPPVGKAVAAESVALIVPGSPTKVTVSVALSGTFATPKVTVAPTTFVSARVEARNPKVIPLASVGVAGWTRTLSVPVAPRTTTSPTIGLPRLSMTVTTTGAASVPFARRVPAGSTTTVEAFASTVRGRPPPPPPLQPPATAASARAKAAARREVGRRDEAVRVLSMLDLEWARDRGTKGPTREVELPAGLVSNPLPDRLESGTGRRDPLEHHFLPLGSRIPLARRAPTDILHRVRALPFLFAVAVPLLAAAQSVPGDAPPTYADDEVAASSGDTRLLWKELDPVLAQRRVLSEDGREALKHLAQSLVLERLAKEHGVSVPDAVVEARWKTLDEQVKASGDPDGIAGMIWKARLSPEEFRKFLRLSFVQETLTRRALGLSERAEVKGEQQELWMDEQMAARKYAEVAPPWEAGIVARCSDFEIPLADLVRTLRRRLPPADLKEDCYQLLLIKKIEARMPDLAKDKLDKAIEEEIQRRRDDTAADPRSAGVTWERRLVAQGYVLDRIRQDPAIRVAALARLWVDRSAGPEGLKRTYESEREHFDGLYGEAIDTSILFLRAARFKNDLNPRTFEEVEGELGKLARGIRSVDDFHRLARERSEDAASREGGGAVGWIGAGTERVPAELRDAVRKALEQPTPGGAGLDPAVSLVGPLRFPTGSALLWLGERRPAPTWDTMSAHVHRELRKRFLDETLPRTSLVTAF